MTEPFFLLQIDRLKRRFGDKHFDLEFIKLASLEVAPMSNEWFRRAIDVWIGNRPITKPPLIVDFKEAKLKEDKFKFDNVVSGAIKVMNGSIINTGLKDLLENEYQGCKTVTEAVEVQRLKNQIAEANAKEANEAQNNGKANREPNTGMAKDEGDTII